MNNIESLNGCFVVVVYLIFQLGFKMKYKNKREKKRCGTENVAASFVY